MQSKKLKLLKSYGIIVFASFLYAVGFSVFYEPNQISFGGVTGIAQVVNFLLPWAPVGVTAIVLNIPLFILGWKFLGGHLLVSSLFAMSLGSLLIDGLDYLSGGFPPLDPLLSCIFGGVLLGVSLGLIIAQGATTGGTDLLARLLKLVFAWLPMGKLLLAIDCLVITVAGVVFHSVYSSLYGVVALYLSTVIIDKVLYGMDTAKVAYIISEQSADILAAIVRELDRGVTVLDGRGGYSGNRKEVLMCAFKQRQIVTLKRLVKEIDPAAFLIVCDAHEVLGDGFREYKQNDI